MGLSFELSKSKIGKNIYISRSKGIKILKNQQSERFVNRLRKEDRVMATKIN